MAGEREAVYGCINDQGKVLLPVVVIASDGLEIEIQASVSLEFDGALALDDDLARRIGWRCLGARKVAIGRQTVLMDQYMGTVALSGVPESCVVLGGLDQGALIGKRLMSGCKLTVDFAGGRVCLE